MNKDTFPQEENGWLRSIPTEEKAVTDSGKAPGVKSYKELGQAERERLDVAISGGSRGTEQDCMRCEETFVAPQISEYCPKCSGNMNRIDMGNAPRVSMLLSTGRTVAHERMANGAQHAYVIGSATGEMTELEWSEYCSLIGGS